MFRRSWTPISRLALAAASALLLSGSLVAAPDGRTALDEYIAKPDPAYKFELVRTIPGDGYTAYVLEMASQTWRSDKEVDRTLWKHWVTVIKPDKVASGSTALLFIGGGNNSGGPPAKVDRMVSSIATATNTVAAASAAKTRSSLTPGISSCARAMPTGRCNCP